MDNPGKYMMQTNIYCNHLLQIKKSWFWLSQDWLVWYASWFCLCPFAQAVSLKQIL